MGYVQLIEDGDARAWRAGDEGTPYAFRSEEDGELTTAFRKAVAEALGSGAVGELDGVERDVAREMAEQVGIRKDASDSLVVAWYPTGDALDALKALIPAVPGSVAPEDLHLTLCYLGDPDQDGSGPWDPTHIAAVLKILSKWCYPLDCEVGGIGRFVGPEDSDALVALINGTDLDCLRHQIIEDLCCYGALPYNSPLISGESDYGFIPHVTLAYLQKGVSTPDIPLTSPVEFKLDGLTLSVGAQRATFEFSPTAEDATDDFAAYHAAQKSRALGGRTLDDLLGAAQPGGYETTPTLDKLLSEGALDEPDDAEAIYRVTKAEDDLRYTLGPLYAPMRKDAHGEYIEPGELQQAAWEYVRASAQDGRRIHLQHDTFGDVTVGEWVECMAWPYDHTILLKQADGTEVEQEMPAGTVYLGVRWDEKAWELVKAGKLGGYSLGGRAVKVATDGDLPDMGFLEAPTRKDAGSDPDGDGDVDVAGEPDTDAVGPMMVVGRMSGRAQKHPKEKKRRFGSGKP